MVNRREFLAAAAVVPFGLRSQLLTAPLALVTCDLESRLALVDLHTLEVVGHIPTHPDPRSIETVGDVALVCHTAVGVLSVVDRHGVRHVIEGFVEPRYTAAHPDGVHAFVTDSGQSGVALVDVVRGKVLQRVSLPGWARHIAISHDASTLWVGLGSASAHVAVVKTLPFRHAGTLTPGFPAHDVGFAPNGELWVTSGADRALAVAAERQAADLAPQHVTFGPERAYVTSGDSGTLHVQALNGRVLARAPVPEGSYNVQYAHGYVITPSLSRGTLAVFDTQGRHLGTLGVAGSCHDACLL
jgi:DNA-binding beta-propeller fold protein YncE